MKKVIDGKRYDTATAEQIAHWSFGNYGDFERCEQTLYRTKRGKWFVHGEGGPRSMYARSLGGGNIGGGEDIVPMSDAEVIAWLEQHNEADVLEQYFSDEIEDA